MERRDLEHLVETYLLANGLPPSCAEPMDFFVLPLTDDHRLGVQWQAGEILLFAHPGYASPWAPQAGGPLGADDEDADEEDGIKLQHEPVDLGVDEHGHWSLHIHRITSLATLNLRMSQPAFGPDQFAAAIDRFGEWFEIFATVMDWPAASESSGAGMQAGPELGFAIHTRV